MEKRSKKKGAALALALILIIACVAGGTFAYLTDKTDKITNTFTVGDIDIDLTETTGTDYKMVPGQDLSKDPTVTVKANKEPAYVYVKVEKTNDPDTYLDYAIADGWTKLDGVDGVYYREVGTLDADTNYSVLAGDKVTVKTTLTTEQLRAIGDNKPTLSFTAYVVQKAGFDTAKAAWDETFGK